MRLNSNRVFVWLDVFGALPARRHGCRCFSRETLEVSRRRGERKLTSLVGNCFPQETSVMETEALSTKRLVSLELRSHSIFSSSSRCLGTVILGKHQNFSHSRLDCDSSSNVRSTSKWAELILWLQPKACIRDRLWNTSPNLILNSKDQSPYWQHLALFWIFCKVCDLPTTDDSNLQCAYAATEVKLRVGFA